jgi:hypothetical protein
MLGGAHIKSLINAKLVNPNNVNTLNKVVKDIQANLTRRFTRERVLRNMLDAHFIINENQKNRLATRLLSKNTELSRNSIKKFLNETNHNVVLTANGKYRVTEKSQGQRLGELNRYVFNSGNVREAFLKNLSGSGTKLNNANRYLSRSSKYSVNNVNGKKYVKFKNVAPVAPTVSKKNVNNSEKRTVQQVRLVIKRHATSIRTVHEMKQLRKNLEALKSGGQAALDRVQENLAAAKKNAAKSAANSAAIRRNRNASHAAKAEAAAKATAEAAQYKAAIEAAKAAGVAKQSELNAATAAHAAALKEQQNSHAAQIANVQRQLANHQTSLNTVRANLLAAEKAAQNASAAEKLKAAENLATAQARHNAAMEQAKLNKEEALAVQKTAHQTALNAEKAAKNAAEEARQAAEAARTAAASNKNAANQRAQAAQAEAAAARAALGKARALEAAAANVAGKAAQVAQAGTGAVLGLTKIVGKGALSVFEVIGGTFGKATGLGGAPVRNQPNQSSQSSSPGEGLTDSQSREKQLVQKYKSELNVLFNKQTLTNNNKKKAVTLLGMLKQTAPNNHKTYSLKSGNKLLT